MGNFSEAATQFERALALEPGFVQAHNNLGRILWEHGNRDQAVRRGFSR